MNNTLFVIKDEEYPNGMFPKIPEHRKSGSWFLLAEGIRDNIIVSDNTTVKQIRQGKYKRLIEISKNTLTFENQFNSSCKESTYTFTVHIRAKVSVHDPTQFYNNIRNIDVQAFMKNQFYLDVGKITRKYSILEYSGLDEELTNKLTSNQVIDDNSGLSYQISNVFTEPNEDARKILKNIDDIKIKDEISNIAREINNRKTYAEAIWEEAARGLIPDTEAIIKIEEYEKKSVEEKIAMLLNLREKDILTDEDVAMNTKNILRLRPSTPQQTASNSVINSILDESYSKED